MRGEMYVDIPPGAHADASFVALTNAGEFRHVGTQFAIAVVDGATRLRVREGRVQWRATDGESTVPAGTEVLIDRDQQRDAYGASTAPGRDWSWTETMAPEIDIEDRPLAEFLEWVARETGRKLVIADERTRLPGRHDSHCTATCAGCRRCRRSMAVMASTSLRFDLPAGVIRVSFAGESPTPRT